jgi:hypothetical protein
MGSRAARGLRIIGLMWLRSQTLVATLALLASLATAAADPVGDVRALRADLSSREASRAQADRHRAELEGRSQALAAQIDAEKQRAAGIARDRRLQELLAEAHSRAEELEHVAADLRDKDQAIAGLRRRIVAACDGALSGNQSESLRLELGRLRTQQVALLATPTQPLGGGPRTATAPSQSPSFDPLDGPRELQEKADLLRDSGDKLRREVRRLSERIDNVERRRHLRERAIAVDEDWFTESASTRHVARASSTLTSRHSGTETTQSSSDKSNSAPTTGTGASGPAPSAPQTPAPPTPAPAAGGSLAAPTDPTPRSDATALRNLVDPATLDELRRADGSDDLERQARALRRAQGELEGLANELDRRAKALNARANDLKNRK